MKNPEQLFIDFLRKKGLAMTLQRKLIAEAFIETEGHFSVEQLCSKVWVKTPSLGQATIYRTLHLLVECGLAECVDFGAGVTLYEHAYGHNHHDHLICLNCGKTVEVFDENIEALQTALARNKGFSLSRHRMYLYGLCPECRVHKG